MIKKKAKEGKPASTVVAPAPVGRAPMRLSKILPVLLAILLVAAAGYFLYQNRQTDKEDFKTANGKNAAESAAQSAQDRLEKSDYKYSDKASADFLALASQKYVNRDYKGMEDTLKKIPDETATVVVIQSKYGMLIGAAQVTKDGSKYTEARDDYKAALTAKNNAEAAKLLKDFDNKYPATLPTPKSGVTEGN